MKKKIFVYSNAVGGGEGPCYAIAEDGTCLGSHLCSNENFARSDLGVIDGSRPDRHKGYAKYYPGGYTMEFVPSDKINDHKKLQKAIKLNREKYKKSQEAKKNE